MLLGVLFLTRINGYAQLTNSGRNDALVHLLPVDDRVGQAEARHLGLHARRVVHCFHPTAS